MKRLIPIICFCLLLNACSGGNDLTCPMTAPQSNNYKYLALGDSYTIGQSVCNTCRFPEQLKRAMASDGNVITTNVIAQTGWTTSNLIAAIDAQDLTLDHDLVTLLIGVNNQYQNKPFALYEAEFPDLVGRAIALARGDKTNVIVVSIPDYAFTPFGQASANPAAISTQIDQYNNFARIYCEQNDIVFVDITDITREGISNPALVATDGLHPSELAYTRFVERILPKARVALQ